MTNLTIYEINTRVWCKEFEAAAGASGGLDAVPDDELDRIAGRGFDAVWLMGVWTTGTGSRAEALGLKSLHEGYHAALPDWAEEDVIGSPFAVQSYTVATSLGGDAALERIRQRLDARGMRLILDFVPNHVGVDHPWISAHPDWFVQGDERALVDRPLDFFASTPGGRVVAHGRDPFFPGWSDTAQLDYRNPEVRQVMSAELESIAQRCDGVRCDMAMLLLSDVFDRTWQQFPPRVAGANGEFWPQAIESARARHPEFMFIFEAYWGKECQLIELAGGKPGRDFAYDKEFYDQLKSGDVGKLNEAICQGEEQLRWGVRFLENHDEPRAADTFTPERHPAASVVALTLPGARLIHDGQLDGARRKLPVQLGRRMQEPPDPAIQRMYDSLVPVVTSDTLRYGQWHRLTARSEADGQERRGVLAWQWQRGTDEIVVCVANLTEAPFGVRLRLKAAHLAGGGARWNEVISGDCYEFPGDELLGPGLPLYLNGFAAKVLVMQ